MSTQSRFIDWTDTHGSIAGQRAKYPAENAYVEIKPHSKGGITSGVLQLASRGPAVYGGRRPQLVTYRPATKDPKSPEFVVLIADATYLKKELVDKVREASTPAEKLRLARAATTSALKWYRLGKVKIPDEAWNIKLIDCPVGLGQRIEEQICNEYRSVVGARPACKTKPTANGPDYVHELTEFLTELAIQLELDGL